MTREEYRSWANDFCLRFPETGSWLRGLENEVRDMWFRDIFAEFDLREALAMNYDLMLEGSVGRFERDKLTGEFIKRMSKLRHRRQQREREVQTRHSRGAQQRVVNDDPVMSRTFSAVQERAADWRRKHDAKYCPSELWKQWVADAWPED